jgi:hypothetical protein
LQETQPRRVRPDDDKKPLLVFTDGAEGDLENCAAACGALMIDPEDGAREFFGEPVPDSLVAEWKSKGKEKIILQAELLPVLLAKQLWHRRMYNRRVFVFVDNEGAKFSCVNMMSDSRHCRRILFRIVQFDIANQNWTWFSRVPSFSNPSDAASRLKLDEMIGRFKAVRQRVAMPSTLL